MFPFEFRLAKGRSDGKDLDLIALINENFGLKFAENQFHFVNRNIGKDEEYIYEASREVGFTVFKSRKVFTASIFALDLDGSADGIQEVIQVPKDYILILKNHPCVSLKFSRNSGVVAVILKAKDESILSCFDYTNYMKFLSQKINSVHIEVDSVQRYSDEFYEKSFLTLENFYTVPTDFENFEIWPRAGPSDYRSFKYNLSDDEMTSFMKSKEFITWLSAVTGLPLLHAASPIYTRCLEAAGDYQILHGNYSEPFGLDVIYSKYPSSDYETWPEKYCGRIHYLNDCGDEIFQVNPINNSLTIVYRTEGCSRFTENVKGFPEFCLFQTIGIYSVAADQ